ncbi:MAG: hypothetical protein AAGB15_06970 [Pseudomonadota bacterium]
MRFLLVAALVLMAACRVPYSHDLADMTVWPEDFPQAGTSGTDLDIWFIDQGYAPGPDVHQARAALMRRPGDPLAYALAREKLWWRTQSRSTRDFCITTRTIFYRLSPEGTLAEAVQTHRSNCR